MKLAKVVGKVVLSKCIDSYGGRTLHLTQDLNEAMEAVGDPEVSAAWQMVGEGDLVIVEVARESANAFEPAMPIDSVILGKVDSVHLDQAWVP